MSSKIIINTLNKMKAEKEKISMLTSYDCCTAKYVDEAGIDIVLVGDSAAMVVLGYDNTNSITIEEMCVFTKAVAKGAKRPMIVADMPFLSYQASIEDAVKNAGKLIQCGANAVKIEGGGDYIVSVIERLTQVGIPVMAHLGFTPQFLNVFGGFKVQGKSQEAVDEILNQAKKVQVAGAFSVVLEMMPETAAKYITENLSIPTISCGAGRYCDGQVLVCDDIFGKYSEFKPKFARRYGDMGKFIFDCAKQYNDDVKSGKFPSSEEVF